MTKIQLSLISLFLGALIIATAWAAIQMVGLREPVMVGMGIGLLFLCALAAWALWVELNFGWRSSALVQRLLDEGETLAVESLAELPRFRADPADIGAREAPLRERLEEHPDQWQAHVQLGMFLGETGRKPEGRRLIRKAFQLTQ